MTGKFALIKTRPQINIFRQIFNVANTTTTFCRFIIKTKKDNLPFENMFRYPTFFNSSHKKISSLSLQKEKHLAKKNP